MRDDNYTTQGRGVIQRTYGRFLQAVGRLFGSERTHSKGRADELRGEDKVDRGMAGERIEGKMQQAGGTVKRDVGEVIGSERMAAEGRAKEIAGEQRPDLNR